MSALSETNLATLKAYCERPVFQKGTKPLKDGVALAVSIDGEGPVTLLRKTGTSIVVEEAPQKPDLTIELKRRSLEILCEQKTEDVGEIGVQILKLMMSGVPEERVNVKVHVGVFDFVFHGYLGILPLGGATIMKFLAEKGFGNISRIKDAIGKMRSPR